jgi:N4-gp56 family major capsid protein
MATTLSTDLDTLVTATHHTVALYNLRSMLFYDALVELDNTESTHRGSSHNFNFYNDIPAQTSQLGETADVTPVTLTDSTRSVTIKEYGAAIETSALLRATAYMAVNPIVAEILGYNAGLSVDTLARNRLEAAAATTDGGVANVVYSDAGSPITTGTEAARNRIAATDVITANIMHFVNAKLRGANVRTFGSSYKGIIHPDASYDLRIAAPNNNWSDPHIHVDPSGIYNAVIGTFAGIQWMESPRGSLFTNAGNGAGGAGNIDAYGAYVMGHEAFGKMFSTADDYGQDPVFVQRPPIDYLQRLRSAGWKHFVGYLVTREECIWRVEAASSIGNNTT